MVVTKELLKKYNKTVIISAIQHITKEFTKDHSYKYIVHTIMHKSIYRDQLNEYDLEYALKSYKTLDYYRKYVFNEMHFGDIIWVSRYKGMKDQQLLYDHEKCIFVKFLDDYSIEISDLKGKTLEIFKYIPHVYWQSNKDRINIPDED